MSSIPLDWFWDPRLLLWSLWVSHSSLGSCRLYRTPNTQGAGTEYSFYTCNIEVIVEMPSLSYQDIHGPPQDSECFSLRGTSCSPSFLGLAHFKESAALKGRAFLSEQLELLLSLPSHLLVCHHHFKVILFSSMNNYLFLLFPPHVSTFSVLCGNSDPQPWRHTWIFQQRSLHNLNHKEIQIAQGTINSLPKTFQASLPGVKLGNLCPNRLWVKCDFGRVTFLLWEGGRVGNRVPLSVYMEERKREATIKPTN